MRKFWFRGATLFVPSLLVVAAALFASCDAWANDSSVSATPLGGLVFEKSDDVQMLSENLKISLDEIDVRYIFKNLSSHDVKLKVGFPLPLMPVGLDDDEENIAGRVYHDQNFNVWIDNKKVESKTDIRAWAIDNNASVTEIDITDKLRAIGRGPYDTVLGDGEKAENLRKLGVVRTDEDGNNPRGVWSIRKTYYWDQIFPAGKEVSVHHKYKPWVGGNPFLTSFQEGFDINLGNNKYTPYCIDKSFADAYSKLVGFPLSRYEYVPPQNGEQERYKFKVSSAPGEYFNFEGTGISEADVAYVLKTGANWAGPIGKFRLEIVKGKAAFVSFCPIPGVKMRKSGNSFVGTAAQFTPTEDLDIYFVGKGVFVPR